MIKFPLAVGLLVLMGFGTTYQILLALGLPLGHGAFGGRYRILPPRLRIASVATAAIFAIGMMAVLEKISAIAIVQMPHLVTGVVWFFAALFGVSVVINAWSPSPIERWVMTPLALASSIACVLLAAT